MHMIATGHHLIQHANIRPSATTHIRKSYSTTTATPHHQMKHTQCTRHAQRQRKTRQRTHSTAEKISRQPLVFVMITFFKTSSRGGTARETGRTWR